MSKEKRNEKRGQIGVSNRDLLIGGTFPKANAAKAKCQLEVVFCFDEIGLSFADESSLF
jgi:hypothetical protein